MTFTESNLRFTFQKQWKIEKYDTHKYYQGLSGAGFKGVDFLGILEDRQLVLFEVKNYTIRNHHMKAPVQQELLDRPELLAQTVSKKVTDTLHTISLVQKYYQRKWWYRNFFSVFRKWYIPSRDWIFWTRAYELSQKTENIWAVLWLESDYMSKDAFFETHELLAKALKGKVGRVQVSNCANGRFMDFMQVERE